jgi:hypothetical protein
MFIPPVLYIHSQATKFYHQMYLWMYPLIFVCCSVLFLVDILKSKQLSIYVIVLRLNTSNQSMSEKRFELFDKWVQLSKREKVVELLFVRSRFSELHVCNMIGSNTAVMTKTCQKKNLWWKSEITLSYNTILSQSIPVLNPNYGYEIASWLHIPKRVPTFLRYELRLAACIFTKWVIIFVCNVK